MEEEGNIPTLLSVKPLKPEVSHLQKIALTSEQFTLGRSIGQSAVIPYISISRQHCIFKRSRNNEWYIQDSSTFGITINNKKMEKGSEVIISDGDIITLEPTAEFVYKFSNPDSDIFEIPKKRIKIEKNTEDTDSVLNNVKIKFEESQNYEMKHIEEKIQNAKQLQTTSIILKQQLQVDMDRKMQLLERDFANQIENLKGEKNEVERQKALLLKERDGQLAQVKIEMEGKIADLMEQIQKHNENESELLKENNLLKDKLDKEREVFLEELSRESTSKKDMLEKLEGKIREQEEVRQREKQELEETLRKETEQLRQAQEKELKEISEQKRLRELQLEQELTNIKQKLQEKVEQTEQQRRDTEQLLNEKMEQLQKISDEEKVRVKQLRKEREDILNQLLEAQKNAETSLAELRKRETELATLAVVKSQPQTDQSEEVITLQDQLTKMKNALESVETEKKTLLSTYAEGAGEGTSNRNALTKIGELMDSELQCSICAEMFIEAMTLNCAHTFCKYCITMWKKKKKDCPICRATITSENRSLVVDNFIERMVNESLTEDMKVKRQDILKARAEVVSEVAQETAGTSTTRGSFTVNEADSEEDYYLDEEGYHEDDYIPDDFQAPWHYYVHGGGHYSDTDSGSDSFTDSDESSGASSGAGAAGDAGARRLGQASAGGGAAGAVWGNAGSAAAGAEALPAADAGPVDASGGHLPGGGSRVRGRRRRRRIPGLPGSYYGGYGQCYCCGARGHWAPGCPFR